MIRALNLFLITGLAIWFFWPVQAADKRILFIGNSYTFGGNVPEQVRRIAASATPPVRYEVQMVAQANYMLTDHLAEGIAQRQIAAGGWDTVVLQDASMMSFSADGRDQMVLSATPLAQAARAVKAKVAYFAHWPPDTPYHPSFPKSGAVTQIEQTYDRLAQATDGTVIRAGAVWAHAWAEGQQGLYAADQHHSSVKGAYAAALAVAQHLGDIDLDTVTWSPRAVEEHEAAALRKAALTLAAP
ncbi:hypothetical protein [Actibacterium sp. 188UL27-1]|uniref:hypothetical protein n=1 Tax=Actibacterium sp. 188UL27-1 TaxID=2786961 RepID=UPI00195E3473|nr:hypothetical protein [Actibacterium sp. 188UL27-1]MBM7068339.1 hypothetical protein [Actibacterium sp. 188UL27-1]